MDLWERKWQGVDSLPAAIGDTMVDVNKDMYTNVYTSLILLYRSYLSPPASMRVRSVSRLRRLETYLRSTMGQERLNVLALIHTHYDIHDKAEEVIGLFARKHPRRLQLTDILNS